MQEPAENHSFIHSSTPSLPSSRLPAWYVYMSVSVPVRLCVRLRPCISVYVRVSVRVHVHTNSTHAYPQKVHIKDTCTRVSWGMWLFLILKISGICRSDRHKKTTRRTSVHPPCLSQLHSVNLCASQSKISLSIWRPKTTVCLAR